MYRVFLSALAVLWFTNAQASAAKSDVDCLARAVLAESTLAKEPRDADAGVAQNIINRRGDGRWGPTVCGVVEKSYPKTTFRTIKKKVEGKVRLMQKAVRTQVCDYSFHCLKKYASILKRAPETLKERARQVATQVLAGTYQFPDEEAKRVAEHSLHYQYAKFSNEDGRLWFICTAKSLGKTHPESVHVHYRDQTEDELEKTLAERPECATYIKKFRYARDLNDMRKAYAAF